MCWCIICFSYSEIKCKHRPDVEKRKILNVHLFSCFIFLLLFFFVVYFVEWMFVWPFRQSNKIWKKDSRTEKATEIKYHQPEIYAINFSPIFFFFIYTQNWFSKEFYSSSYAIEADNHHHLVKVWKDIYFMFDQFIKRLLLLWLYIFH